MWAEVAQTRKNIEFFWYKFVPKGYTPLSNFYEICCGEGVQLQGPQSYAKFHRCGFKMWAYGRKKIAKNGNFWSKLRGTVGRTSVSDRRTFAVLRSTCG